MTNIYVLYHSGCFDGFGAALAAWKKFGDRAKYINVKHGDPPPEIPDGAEVYILDFAYPRDILLKLAERTTLKVLDHHATAQRDLEGLPFATFDMNKSGCVLAWEFFFPTRRIPLLLQHMQDRDLWLFKMRDTAEIFAAVQSYKMEFHTWNEWLNDEHIAMASLKLEGRLILRFKNQVVDNICKNGIVDVMAGHPIVICNCTSFWSEVGDVLLKKFPDVAISAPWYRRKDGREQWSLRSRVGGVDVSEIAKKLGGGGHKQAAGFVIDGSNNGRRPYVETEGV